MERKVYHGAMAFKDDGQPGEFSAVFSTFDVIDHDRDVTLPGAFEENAPVRIAAWGHGWDQLPVGRGEIHAAETEAKVDGRFFLDTTAGKEHYLTVKALGDLQEWSYSFDILEHEYGKRDGQDVRFLKRLKVHEVSPVMLGAGIDTRTLDIKGADMAKEQTQKSLNLTKLIETIIAAFETQFNPKGPDMDYGEWAWVREIYDDHLLVNWKSETYQVNYRLDDGGNYVFTPRPEWIGGAYIFIAGAKAAQPFHRIKAGARHTGKEYETLQNIHDMVVEFGASCVGHGEIEDEASDGKSRVKHGESTIVRIAVDIIDYDLQAPKEGA